MKFNTDVQKIFKGSQPLSSRDNGDEVMADPSDPVDATPTEDGRENDPLKWSTEKIAFSFASDEAIISCMGRINKLTGG